MEIGDGRCFAMSFSLSPFLPFFPPFVTRPSLLHFVLLPCTEYIQRSHTHTHTYVYTKCVPCFLSLRAPSSSSSSFFSSSFSSASPSRPVRSSLLLVALNERVDSRATTYVCPDLKIVRLWSSRAERGVPNEPEIRSQLRTRER